MYDISLKNLILRCKIKEKPKFFISNLNKYSKFDKTKYKRYYNNENMVYRNILFIDENIANVNSFICSTNETTLPITFNRYSKGCDIINLLENYFINIDRICIVTDDFGFDSTKYFINNEPYFYDSDFNNTKLSTNIKFILSLVSKFKINTIDFLACNSLQYKKWRQYYNILEKYVIVGASSNRTGNPEYGGDWIMESTNQDIRDIYFSELILLYTGTLVGRPTSEITINCIISTNTISIAGGSFNLSGLLLYSREGIYWTIINTNTSLITNYTCIQTNGSIILAGGDGFGLMKSTDGITWTESTQNIFLSITSIVWDGNKWFICGISLSSNMPSVASTTDLSNWTIYNNQFTTLSFYNKELLPTYNTYGIKSLVARETNSSPYCNDAIGFITKNDEIVVCASAQSRLTQLKYKANLYAPAVPLKLYINLNNVIVICNDGKMYGSGNNNGQLGNNLTTSSPIFSQMFGNTFTPTKLIHSNLGSENSYGIIDKLGRFTICGSNSNQMIVNSADLTVSDASVCWDYLSTILGQNVTVIDAIKIGNSTTETYCILDSTGYIWTSGYNRHGQCGQNSSDIYRTWGRLTNPPNIVKIYGYNSGSDNNGNRGGFFAIISNNDLYGWGFNQDGLLGSGDKINKITPLFIMINCVEVYGTQGQGLPNYIRKTDNTWSYSEPNTWTLINIPNIIKLFSGHGNTIFMITLDSGKYILKVSGGNVNGLNGTDNTNTILVNNFINVPFNKVDQIVDIYSESDTSGRTIILLNDGTAYLAGQAIYNVLDTNNDYWTFTKIKV